MSLVRCMPSNENLRCAHTTRLLQRDYMRLVCCGGHHSLKDCLECCEADGLAEVLIRRDPRDQRPTRANQQLTLGLS